MTYTGWAVLTVDGRESKVMDIPTLLAMPASEYNEYAKGHLLYIDHHEVIRSTVGDYPLATSAAQVDELIKLLEEYKQRMT